MIPVIDQVLGRFSSDIAVDLGTANTLVYVKGKGVVIREPSIICRHKKTKKIIAIGSEAKKMLGRTPANIEVIRPMHDGVISDFDITCAMLTHFVRKVHTKPSGSVFMPRPKMVIGVPSNISKVEKRAVLDAAYQAGARQAHLVEEALAAAIGVGIAVDESVGSMVVDIGGGTTEIAVISLGGVVAGRSLKIGGDAMDLDIINYVRTRYGLGIGERTAEDIKMALGSAYAGDVEKEMVIRGQDLEKGLPKTVRVSSVAIREALAPTINTIVEGIRETIEDAPPELGSDIAERGIVLCGGGSQISGLAKLTSKETRMPVSVVNEPLESVILGVAKLLENPRLLKTVKIVSG